LAGLDTVDIKIKKPKLDINTHYNNELSSIHSSTLSYLKSNEKSGLHLFYGPPGTGKSTYIRYLLRSIRKPVIFIPPGLASNLDAPNFTSFLIKNTDTVFVIEDAEDLLVSRNGSRNASLSMILNLTDGLLGECFGIQIIATFNTDLINIDKALLRKGRLLTKYEFGKLSVEKSRSLLHSLGHYKFMVEQPMTLAEIFNIQEVGYDIKSERTPIGFLANAS
jgi:SpoVK/Ycf46/Vps4 family AAA+-type ATPase